MEREELLRLLINKVSTLIIFPIIIAGCATQARDLPIDHSSIIAKQRLSIHDFNAVDAKLTCSEIDEELKTLEEHYSIQLNDIKSKRQQNQINGYIGGVFFLPALLATDNSTEAKKKIDDINKAKDLLYKLRAFKKCPINYKSEI